jgi:sec-independent protein translocase protein TatA
MFEGLFRPMHLLLILFIVLIIFGPGKLPEIGEELGKSIKSFKKAMTEKDEPKDEPRPIEQKAEKGCQPSFSSPFRSREDISTASV